MIAGDPPLALVLPAVGPQAWLDEHLAARFAERGDDGAGPGAVVETADLLADDAAVLRDHHARLVAGGTPAPAAATYLADWYAGAVALAVGYGLATAGAGFLVGGDAGGGVGFHLHPGGWPTRVELPARAVATADHPWAGTAGTEVAASSRAVLERAVHELVAGVAPIIDACHRTARVGAVGLWNEVADALGRALAFQHLVEVDERIVAVLAAAVAVDGVPWKARPRLGFARSERLGAVHVVQKGGCCLAYTAPNDHVPTADDPGLTPYLRAYLCRFPVEADAPRYCSTCSFRDAADADARQLFWYEHHRPTA